MIIRMVSEKSMAVRSQPANDAAEMWFSVTSVFYAVCLFAFSIENP